MNEKIINRKWLWPTVSGLAVLAVLAGGLVGLDAYYNGKTLPNQKFAGVKVGGLEPKQAEELIMSRWQALQTAEFELVHENETQKIAVSDLGVTFKNPNKSINKLRVYNEDESIFSLVGALINTDYVPVYVRTDQTVAETNIYQVFENLYRRENAYFAPNEEGGLLVKPGRQGYVLAWKNTYDQLMNALAKADAPTINLHSTIVLPTITEADLLEHQDTILALVTSPLTLTGEGEQWTYDFRANIESLRFEKWEDEQEGDLPYKVVVSPDKWHNYVQENLVPKLERNPDNVQLKLASEKVEFAGNGTDGQKIEHDKLLAAVNDWLNTTEKTTVETPITIVKAEVVVDKALEEMGIVDLVATGYTTYNGSPNNRKHNIRVGLERFNGVIVKPGETFSFNNTLGPVESYTGYLPELVIKPEGTIPEYGGGICQVSTTFYRAILNADLPITERKPHSYAVSYYAQQMGHGLDATIYIGGPDLKFTNDTPGALVIQAYAVGTEAFIKLYGTPTGKEVSYDGPYISGRVGAPAPVYVTDNSLAPGYKKQVEKAHNGFDVMWYKTVKHADGRVEKKEIFSRYKAIPARFIVGPTPPATQEVNDEVAGD